MKQSRRTDTMKQLGEMEKKLKELKPTLRNKYKVETIGLFGSYIRGQQKGESDLDILVEFSEPIGLLTFIELENFLSEKLEAKVDLVMRNALKPRIKDRIIKEAIYL
ncbi:MAG: nucleotidyltransferase family protein [Candidatus Bathyarchaeia archaeon]